MIDDSAIPHAAASSPASDAPRRNDSFVRAAVGVALLGLSTVLVVGPAVAQSSAWFSVTPPTGLASPPQLDVIGAPSFQLPPSVPAGEENDSDLEGERILPLVETIVGFSRQSQEDGQMIWGRVSGFPGAAATAEWVAEEFRSAGLTGVELQEIDATSDMWWADSWEVRILSNARFGAGTEDVILHSALPTGGSEITEGPLTASLIWVGTAGEPDDVDVDGKIAVQHARPARSAYSERSLVRESAGALIDRGAVAVINYIEQPGNMHIRDFSGCGGPCFNVGGADGAFLRDVLDRAGEIDVEARLTLDAGERAGLTAHNVIGIVPGVNTDENVIVNAHLDGWFDAAGDNGDGLAVVIALARHFAKPEHRPGRNLLFVASAGHHSSGLNGPRAVVSMNPELTARSVLAINLEHIAQYEVATQPWGVNPTEQPMGFGISNQAPLLIELADRGIDRYGFKIRSSYGSSVPGDLGGYGSLGIPRVQAIHSGPLYHTSGDVLESISVPGLERAARYFAFYVREVANAPRVAIDP